MRALFYIIALTVSFALAYLLLWPIGIKPLAWDAPVNKGYTGEFSVNQKLKSFTKLTMGGMSGPEAAVQSPDGSLISATHEGWLMRWDHGETEGKPLLDVGGRPLGVDFDPSGNLWIANAYKGLMKLSATGDLSTVVTEVDGSAVGFADDVSVAPNGKVYFTDASTRFAAADFDSTMTASVYDLMEHSDNGRVIEYDPISQSSKVVLSGITFANGIAVAPDGQFFLVIETGEYRVWKHWLSGAKAGESEVIIDNLPGFPDNIHLGQNGRFWFGLVSPRSEAVDDLSSKPFWRSAILRLPQALQPAAKNYGMVIAINAEGDVLHNLQAPSAEVFTTTGVAETDDYIYVTSLTSTFLARYSKQSLGID